MSALDFHQLREIAERYQRLLELLPDAIVIHSDGIIVYANAAGVNLFAGSSEKELLGMPYMEFIHPDDHELLKQRIEMIYNGRQSPLREYRICSLDGRVTAIEATGTLISYNGMPANLVTYRDITARKKANAALKENMSRYQSLFENSPTCLWEEDWSGVKEYIDALKEAGVTDLSSYLYEHPAEMNHCLSLLRLLDANQAAVIFYGAKDKSYLLAHMAKIFSEDTSVAKEDFNPCDSIRLGIAAFVAGCRTVVSDGLTKTLAGEERNVVYHTTLSPGYEDSWAKVIISMIDVTCRTKAEERLKILNAELCKEESHRRMLACRLMDMCENDRRNVAMELHDHLGQDLSTLKIDLEMLSIGLHASNMPQLIERVEVSIDKVSRIMGDIKKLAAGLMPSMIETLGLLPSLRSLVGDFASRTGLDIQFFCTGVSGRFEHDKEMALYRIAQESLNNTYKHAQASKVFINLILKGDVLRLSLEDNGVGFDQEMASSRLGRGGPLGLHIMRERAFQVGGDCIVESRVGAGTHVLIEIPLKG